MHGIIHTSTASLDHYSSLSQATSARSEGRVHDDLIGQITMSFNEVVPFHVIESSTSQRNLAR